MNSAEFEFMLFTVSEPTNIKYIPLTFNRSATPLKKSKGSLQ